MATVRATLQTLIKSLVGAETLIFADQNAPRPALPYWTMRVSTRRSVGEDWYSQGVDNSGDQTVYGSREVTVQVQRIGPGSDEKCQDLIDNLSKTTVQEQWQIAGMSLYDNSDAGHIPFKLDNEQLEQRSSVDLFVRFGVKLLDRVGAIQYVNIAGEFEDKEELILPISVVLY